MPAPISVPAECGPAQNGQQADFHLQSLMLLQSKLAELQKSIPISVSSGAPGSKLVAQSRPSASSQIDMTPRPNHAIPEASLQSLMAMSSQLAELGQSIGALPAGHTAPIPAATPFSQSPSSMPPAIPFSKEKQAEYLQSLIPMTSQLAELRKSLATRSEQGAQSPGRLSLPPLPPFPSQMGTLNPASAERTGSANPSMEEYLDSLKLISSKLDELQKSIATRSAQGAPKPGRFSLPPLPPILSQIPEMRPTNAASAERTGSANPSMEEYLQSLKLMSSKLDELQKAKSIGTTAECTAPVVTGPVAEFRPSMPSPIGRSTAMPACYETMFASLNSLASALAKIGDSLGALSERPPPASSLSTGSLSSSSSQTIDMLKQGAIPARPVPESRPETPSSLPVPTDRYQPESGSQTLMSISNRLAELEKSLSKQSQMRTSLLAGLPTGPLPSQAAHSSQIVDKQQLVAGPSGGTTPESRSLLTLPSSLPLQSADMQRQVVAPGDLPALLGGTMTESFQNLMSVQSELTQMRKSLLLMLANCDSTGAGSLPSLPPLPPQFSEMPKTVAAPKGTMPETGPLAESHQSLLNSQSEVDKMQESFAELAARFEERQESLNRVIAGIKRGALDQRGDESDANVSSSFDKQKSETRQIESRPEDRTTEKAAILNTRAMIRSEASELKDEMNNNFREAIKTAIRKTMEKTMEEIFAAIPNIFPGNASVETTRDFSADSSCEQDEEQMSNHSNAKLEDGDSFQVPEPIQAMMDDFAVALREKLLKSTQEIMAGKLERYQLNLLEDTKRALSPGRNRIEDRRHPLLVNDAVQDRCENDESISDNSNAYQSDGDALDFESEGVSDLMEKLNTSMSNLLETLSSFQMAAGYNRASNRQVPCNCPDCSYVGSAPRKLRLTDSSN